MSNEAPTAQAVALARLAQSRARLQAVLLPAAEPPGPAGSAPWRARRRWMRWRRLLGKSPIVDVALGALQSWWAHQRWRPAVEAVGEEFSATLGPAVRRHPWLAIAVAAAAGAALAAARPWRWSFLRQRTGPAAQALLHTLIQQATSWPVQAAVASALSAWLAARRAPGREADPAPQAQGTGATPDATPDPASAPPAPSGETP